LIVNLKLRMGPGLAGIEIGSSWRQAVHRNEIGQFSAVGGMVESQEEALAGNEGFENSDSWT
jgi:hypothetical protein